MELDELAAEFGMKVTDAVALVQRLEAERKLTGIMDDRGKVCRWRACGLRGLAWGRWRRMRRGEKDSKEGRQVAV